MKATILGCGGSGGVPAVGWGWGKCDPANPKNRRTRVSLLVEAAANSERPTTVLVDTSPDLRQQLLAAEVDRIDAVIYTHAHADHVHGIDDLRGLNVAMGRPMDIYADPETLGVIKRRFDYVFEPLNADYPYKPTVVAHEIGGAFSIGAVDAVPFWQDHGYSRTLGLRFGPLAYSTDVVGLDEAAFDVLEGVDTWIVDCLREEPHPTHSHLAQTLSWIDRVRPRRAILTHMNTLLDYEALRAKLPLGIEPGYDGMVLEI
jgi:phosphoribosyl 1,2-cyclic phosphate phosphodiesterase